MVPVGDYRSLILLDPGVNEIYYCGLLLPQQLLLVIRQSLASSETVLQCTGHTSLLTLVFHKVV